MRAGNRAHDAAYGRELNRAGRVLESSPHP
jgi:hypothetical protein